MNRISLLAQFHAAPYPATALARLAARSLRLLLICLIAGLLPLGLPVTAQRGAPEPRQSLSPAAPTANITVNTTSDDNVVNGNCTIREAIIAANTNTAKDACPAGTGTENTILFNIPGGLTNPQINISSLDGGQLPAITKKVTINGANGPVLFSRVVLNGFGAGTLANGLVIQAGASFSTIRSLIINRFNGSGIVLSGGSNNVIESCFIGTDTTSGIDLGNNQDGIQITGSTDNRIGGDAFIVISGNNASGIYLSAGATRNTILNNSIGTNSAVTTAVGNTIAGVYVDGVSNNTIGGAGANQGNFISGNLGHGIVLINGATANNILGNLIGLGIGILSEVPLGNGRGASGGNGIEINNAPLNSIGGISSGQGNVISANLSGPTSNGHGIHITGSGANGNFIAGNIIGLNRAGTTIVGNTGAGVFIDGAPGTTIGTTAASARNLISGNAGSGVDIRNTTTTQVENNYIGTDVGGTLNRGNGGQGVYIQNASDNRIGQLARNVISGNSFYGVAIIAIGGSSTGNLIQQNRIGTNAGGTTALGNSSGGVWIDNAATNTIGGTSVFQGNLISGNGGAGLLISAGSTGNAVQGNYIGTNAATTAAIPNTTEGVNIVNATNNTIGGTSAGARNIISGNTLNGVVIANSSATGNVVTGNYVGLNGAGASALRNAGDGVQINNAPNNTIGGTAAGAGNVISGNNNSGVYIEGASASGNQVLGNIIGLAVNGDTDLGNGIAGVFIGSAPNNTIGAGGNARNIISGNNGSGVRISSAAGNAVRNNYIGTDASGTLDRGNTFDGVLLENATSTQIGVSFANLISGNDGNGVRITGASAMSNTVSSNSIGTNAAGTAALGNADNGVVIEAAAKNNIIGATASGVANIISGNASGGVVITGSGTTGNVVLGNYIGTNNGATAAVGNAFWGVLIASSAQNNIIGGATATARNIISGNQTSGIILSGPATTGNSILGNFIGTKSDGATALGNALEGVLILSPQNNFIGGLAAGEGNVIAFNSVGVAITAAAAVANRIVSNSIFSNTGLGIDLGAVGVTPNDAGDPDTGPNRLQNFPLLTQVLSYNNGSPQTNISGALNSEGGQVYRIQFFANDACDSSGNGEGKTFLGDITSVLTNGSGNANFSTTLPIILTSSQFVTATATNIATNDTSEFSACRAVLTPTITIADVSVIEGNSGLSNAVFAVTLIGASGAPGNFTVNYATANGTATAPGDYTATSGTLTFSGPIPSNAFSLPISVPVAGDTLFEANETFFVNLSNANLATITDNQGQCSILNDDSSCGGVTITINPPTLPNGFAGTPYNQTLTASGGAPAYTFSISSGALPGGLGLSSGGALTGTPTAAGTFNFTVTATDASTCTGARAYTMIISGNGLMFYSLPAPVRLLDTRFGASPNACSQPNQPIAGGASRTQPARGICTIPAGAQAITGNVTTVNSGGGYLTLYPSGAAQPTVASTNYGPNEIINNVFTAGLGAGDGAFNIFALTTTDVVVDVTGYYAPPGAGGLFFHPLPAPVRLLETRAGEPAGCVRPGAPLVADTETLQTAATACTGIPAAARAVVGNATTVDPQANGYLTLFPANAAKPLVASSNFGAGQAVNGPFAVGLSPASQFKIYTLATTHLVIDLLGYYSEEVTDANGAGLLFTPLARPVRLLETRAGEPVGCFKPGAPLNGNQVYTQPARGLCDGLTVPSNALGVAGNATTVSPVANGYLTLWPSTATQPTTATSNYNAGQAVNRHFIVGLGAADGAFKMFSLATTHLVIDLAGYFAP